MEQVECKHSLNLCNRSSGNITGVVDVISFDPDTILMETELGMLTIKGQELHVSRLCLEKGEVDIEGKVQLLQYSENGEYAKRKKGSLVKRLFQ